MAMDEKMWRKQHFSEKEVENPFGYVYYISSYIPRTLNNHFLMDVWWYNHFPSKGLESFNWNNHFKGDVSGARYTLYIRTSLHPHFRSWIFFRPFSWSKRKSHHATTRWGRSQWISSCSFDAGCWHKVFAPWVFSAPVIYLNMTNLLKFVGRTLNLKLFRIDINFKANIFIGNKHPYKCLVPSSPKKSPVIFLLALRIWILLISFF